MHRRWGVTGLICRCSALRVVVGLSLPRTRRRWWANLSSFGAMRRRWAILVVVGLSLGPYSSWLVGPFIVIGSQSGPTRRPWNVTEPDLFSLGLVVLLFVVGSSFPHAGVIHVSKKRWRGQRQGRKRTTPS